MSLKVGSPLTFHQNSRVNLSPKFKACGFALITIAGVGALIAGLIGYFSGMAPETATILMVTGGVGTLFLIAVIVHRCLIHARSQNVRPPQVQPAVHQSGNDPYDVYVQTDSKRRTVHTETCSRINAQSRPITAVDFVKNAGFGTIRGETRFGKVEWKEYFGIDVEEPPLPSNLNDILNSPCPFADDDTVKVKDTHMLVLAPTCSEGTPLRLEKLISFANRPTKGCFTTSSIPVGAAHTSKFAPIVNSHWILMTRGNIPTVVGGSEEKLNSFKRYADYSLPSGLEILICLVAEYVQSAQPLILAPKDYALCTENGEKFYVGMCGLTGFYFMPYDKWNPLDKLVGIAAQRKLL